MKKIILFIALSACFFLPLLAQLQWPQPAKLMEYKPVSWRKSSVNISENIYHVWTQADISTSRVYLQANNSEGDSLWQIIPDSNPDQNIYQTCANVITTSDNCLIITWLELNPFPNTRMKAQKITQSGQLLWGENGVYLSDTFTCNDPDGGTFDNAYDRIAADNNGGAYIYLNHEIEVLLLKVSNNGTILWQDQLNNTPGYPAVITKAYPDGFYIFSGAPTQNETDFVYRRYSDSGDILFNSTMPSYQYDQIIHIYPDNSFLISSFSTIVKYSALGELTWTISNYAFGDMVFTNEYEFYILQQNSTPDNQINIRKYGFTGEPISSQVILPSAINAYAGMSPNGKLNIIYQDASNNQITKLQILNPDNTFQFEQGISLGIIPPFVNVPSQSYFCFLNDTFIIFKRQQTPYSVNSDLTQYVFNYQGYNLQKRSIIESGYNHDVLNQLNEEQGSGFNSNFFADENSLNLFQQVDWSVLNLTPLGTFVKMHKLNSEGINLFSPTGKTIAFDVYPANIAANLRIHETPAHNFIFHYWTPDYNGYHISAFGDSTFTYYNMNRYSQFVNRPDCIWSFYSNPSTTDTFVHRLVNETTFENNVTNLSNGQSLIKIQGEYLLYSEYSASDNLFKFYLQNLTDDLTFNPLFPNQGLLIATSLYTPDDYFSDLRETSQNLIFSWLSRNNGIPEYRIQIINKSDNSMVFPVAGYLMDYYPDYPVNPFVAFENNVFNVLYLDYSNEQNVLKLQKYTLVDDSLATVFPDGGLTISDSVHIFTAKKFGNSLVITYVRGIDSYQASLYLTRFINNNNDLSNLINLGKCDYYHYNYRPLLLPIDEQNTYLVWKKGSRTPLDRYNTFLVQKVNITQLPVQDLTISPSQPLTLSQNYPNPFNPETTISFSLPVENKVKLEIYNIKGQKVTTLLDEQLASGKHNITWKGTNSNQKHVSSGIYFYKLSTPTNSITRKMLLVK